VSALQLFAVAGLEPGDGGPLAPETELLVYRDVGAVVRRASWARPTTGERDVDAYRTVIESVFARRPVLPAPVGTLFRSELALRQWLELHYVSLSEGIAFVEGKAMARLHVAPALAPRRAAPAAPSPGRLDVGEGVEKEGGEGTANGTVGAQAAELFRELRRHSAAAIPLPRRDGAAEVIVGSFLVERERWRAFEEAATELGRQAPGIAVRLSGPWPPYDFVRLQFGG
jgi:hypothetical protein